MSKNERYCVRTYEGKCRIWNRKMQKWWGLPYKEFPYDVLAELNARRKNRVQKEKGR